MKPAFSDYIVYVDESGDHGLESIDPQYPVFVLVFCLFLKEEYAGEVLPAVTLFKFRHFGHDMVVLHERDIRKATGAFGFLTDAVRRQVFVEDLADLVENAAFTLIASVIRKDWHRDKYHWPDNPYDLALRFGLERIAMFLDGMRQLGRTTRFVLECRGRKEDMELELEFRRVCAGANILGQPLPFEITLVPKTVNAAGLQLADLAARPVGRHILNPHQPNRAYEIVQRKLRRSAAGTVEGWGIKTFP